MTQLTTHFTEEEMTFTQVRGYDNKPVGQDLRNLLRTATAMEGIRDLFGSPINVHSGFRCTDVNRVVGGVPNSAHRFGLACDFDIAMWGTNRQVWERLKQRVVQLEIDQLILEFENWVHVGLAGPGLTDSNGAPVLKPRGMIFTIGCPA